MKLTENVKCVIREFSKISVKVERQEVAIPPQIGEIDAGFMDKTAFELSSEEWVKFHLKIDIEKHIKL